ncbi:MAG: hypothetical protein ACRECX_02590 [Methyloceanibacter sp.]|uniref:hypothetical protein n=1 Tax=Methyloceanibacter sp. TaxID=1965321 RepID=UPI003D6CFAC3
MTATACADRILKLAGVLACVALLGGCGGGVELQGKVFDYMGVSGDRQEPDVQMTERPPLLVPPSVQSLPSPGQGSAVTARQDWPDDPEKVRKRVAKEQEAKKAEIQAAANPTNPYAGKPTLLDKLFKGSESETEPVPDVPEPDASDRLPESNAVAESRPKPLTPHVPQEPLPERPPEGPQTTSDAYEGMSNPSGNQAGW